MLFKELHMRDFLAHRNTTIDLSEVSYAAITGPNGSGKTSIAAAIAWVLFGTTRSGLDSDSVIHDAADETSVTLTFDDAKGQTYRVQRYRRRSPRTAIKLGIYRQAGNDWELLGDHTKDENQRLIEEVVGLNEDAFYSFLLLDQSSGNRFMDAKPQKRRDILLSLMPELSIWKERHTVAEARTSEARKLVESHTHTANLRATDLADLEAEAENNTVSRDELVEASVKAEKEVARLNDEYAHKCEEVGAARSGSRDIGRDIEKLKSTWAQIDQPKLERAIKDAKVTLKAHHKAHDDLAELEANQDKVAAELKHTTTAAEATHEELTSLEKNLGLAQAEAERFDKILTKAEDREDRLIDEINKLAEEYKAAKNNGTGACDTCKQDVTGEYLETRLAGLKDERKSLKGQLSDLEAETKAASENYDSATENVKELKAKIKACRDNHNKLESECTRLRTEQKHLASGLDEVKAKLAGNQEADLLAAITAAEEAHRNAEDQYNDALEALERSQEDANELDGITDMVAARDALADELAAAKKELAGIQKGIEKHDRDVEAIKNAREQLAAVQEDLKDAAGALEVAQSVSEATSSRGIPAMLLDQTLSEIETRQNELLAAIPGGETMRVEFRQERKNRTNSGSKSLLDIIVHTDNNHSRPVESFSYGERVRLVVSNLFAMVEVINARRPGTIQSLFLDEPLGPLDAASIPAFLEILMTAVQRDVVRQVCVVSHDPRVTDGLPQRLELYRQGDSAEVDAKL